MQPITRRQFGGSALLPLLSRTRLFAAGGVGGTLQASVERHKVPFVAAMVATADKPIWSGAFGKRDAASGVAVTPDSIFAIASMTKAVTTVAALQLVEAGKLSLTEPVGSYLPQLAKLQVLHGYDAAGKPALRPVSKPVTLRHLLTHTSGFAYDTWDETMFQYVSKVGTPPAVPPLMFEPGTRWQYGTGVDSAGRIVEAVSEQSLEEYFQSRICGPLAMPDTSFILPPAKFDRLVTRSERQPDGSLKENPRQQPATPTAYNGGGGLYSTIGDYTRFMQMILRQGKGPGTERILQPKTVALMTTNQIGSLSAGKMKSFRPERSSEVLFHRGATDGFTLGFLINRTAYADGRSAGSLAWAGLYNTFYWIDPHRGRCAVIMMQFLPFVDPAAMGVLNDFERAVYEA